LLQPRSEAGKESYYGKHAMQLIFLVTGIVPFFLYCLNMQLI